MTYVAEGHLSIQGISYTAGAAPTYIYILDILARELTLHAKELDL